MKEVILFFDAILLTVSMFAQTCGCTDPLASNYNPVATANDGSCLYDSARVEFTTVSELDARLAGTSGMIFWNGGYWTYLDHNDLNLYRLDSLTGAVTDSLRIAEAGNRDTEEISQDADHLYFGDFGNNTGSRTDLHILKIAKQPLLNSTHTIDTIFFSYPDQTDFTPNSMATDFDCEAFIVGEDSIYLFTKQWVTLGTACYAIPKEAGIHVAHKTGDCPVGGLVTGATYLPEKRIVVLCGYSPISELLTPFFYLLYDFQGERFFTGNKRKLLTNSSLHQVEAIASSNGLTYYLTNEHLSYSIVNIPPKLHKLDLTRYLNGYLTGNYETTSIHNPDGAGIRVYPNPASERLTVSGISDGTPYIVYGMDGRMAASGTLVGGQIPLDGASLQPGSYILSLKEGRKSLSFRFIKR